MTPIQEIAERLRSLSSSELREVRELLDDYEDQRWGEQFEAEVEAGKWDALADKVLRNHREGIHSGLRHHAHHPLQA
jgi:hypothetical protein